MYELYYVNRRNINEGIDDCYIVLLIQEYTLEAKVALCDHLIGVVGRNRRDHPRYNHVANPTHSLYVIKPRIRVAVRKGRVARVEFADVTTYIAARGYGVWIFYTRCAGGDSSLVILDRGNPRGRAVRSNHLPEIWQRSSTGIGWCRRQRSTPKSRLNICPLRAPCLIPSPL